MWNVATVLYLVYAVSPIVASKKHVKTDDRDASILSRELLERGRRVMVIDGLLTEKQCASIRDRIDRELGENEGRESVTLTSPYSPRKGPFEDIWALEQQLQSRAAKEWAVNITYHYSSLQRTIGEVGDFLPVHSDNCAIIPAANSKEASCIMHSLNTYVNAPAHVPDHFRDPCNMRAAAADFSLRAFTAIAYFATSEPEQGGQLLIAAPFTGGHDALIDIALTPRCGRAVIINSGILNPHGVTATLNGTRRYAMQAWFKNVTKLVYTESGEVDGVASVRAGVIASGSGAALLANTEIDDAYIKRLIRQSGGVDYAISYVRGILHHSWPITCTSRSAEL